MGAMKALLVVPALCAFPATAQQEVDNAKRAIASLDGLLKERPNDPTLWFYMARFQTEAGERAASIAALEKVLALGNGFLPPRDGFERIWDDRDFHALVAN